jgi:acetyl esterase/lipase
MRNVAKPALFAVTYFLNYFRCATLRVLSALRTTWCGHQGPFPYIVSCARLLIQVRPRPDSCCLLACHKALSAVSRCVALESEWREPLRLQHTGNALIVFLRSIVLRSIFVRRIFVLSLLMVCLSGFFVQAPILSAGEPPAFRVEALNREAAYPACAVFDVDRDGHLDIFSGGFWYQAPRWTRHPVREVEVIRGRFDDYSNLPYDVDGDGWTDVISCNYRSESIYWVRNPGQVGQLWQKFVAAVPGPMETGRLVDIDGDGQLDLLPNGTQFAAWWKLLRNRRSAEEAALDWQRCELPTVVAGHGIGAGDINGDGRVDIVYSGGWCEQTADGNWVLQREFRLHPDASIPILVWDVDQDGDADIVWGRGHRFGLYWLEQTRNEQGGRTWRKHVIDTSWSQAHSLILGDFDGDGQPELVSGSRYLGHDGRDLGEYDPLVVAWYRFDSQTRTWTRRYIHRGARVALGLNPAVADLDSDGDLDLVLADRGGLYIAWNDRIRAPQTADTLEAMPPVEQPGYQVDHRQPLRWLTSEGEPIPITKPEEWGVRRDRILTDMQTVMGTLPEPSLRVPLDVRILEQTDAGSYTRLRIRYQAEPQDSVPAYLLIPKKLQGRAPAMLCLHQTIGIGKDEPAGLGGSVNLHYGHELAERGFVCIIPDYPSFGEYPFDFRAAAQRYASGSLKAVWNNIRAVDVLETLDEVDPDRIGAIGHSLGGHNALFTAAFDQRIKAVVTSCGFTPFHDYYKGDLRGWTSDRYMPAIARDYQNDPDRVPFDFYEVLAAIAPRHVFVNAPLHDSNFDVEGVRKVESCVKEVYGLLKTGSMVYVYPDCGHDFPAEVREQAYQWLGEVLR